jgi:hypothetical protein
VAPDKIVGSARDGVYAIVSPARIAAEKPARRDRLETLRKPEIRPTILSAPAPGF